MLSGAPTKNKCCTRARQRVARSSVALGALALQRASLSNGAGPKRAASRLRPTECDYRESTSRMASVSPTVMLRGSGEGWDQGFLAGSRRQSTDRNPQRRRSAPRRPGKRATRRDIAHRKNGRQRHLETGAARPSHQPHGRKDSRGHMDAQPRSVVAGGGQKV